MDLSPLMNHLEMKRIFEQSYGRLGFSPQPVVGEDGAYGKHLVVTMVVSDADKVVELKLVPNRGNLDNFIREANKYCPADFKVLRIRLIYIPSEELPFNRRVFEQGWGNHHVPRWQLKLKYIAN
jgi:hypothetical protein